MLTLGFECTYNGIPIFLNRKFYLVVNMLSDKFMSWFKSTAEVNDLQHLHNKLYEQLYKTFSITHSAEDIKQLQDSLEMHSADTKFNNLILNLFENTSSAYEVKEIIKVMSEEDFSNMASSTAVSLLKDIQKHVQSQAVKNFLGILCFDPVKFYGKCEQQFHTLGYEVFQDFVAEKLQELPELAVDTESDEFLRLITWICQKDTDGRYKIADRKYLNVDFGSEFVKFDDIMQLVFKKHDELIGKHVVLKGFNLDNKLITSVRIMALLAPHWNNINASTLICER